MTVMTTLPWSRPLTKADLATMPDDGHRYELLDGALLVTPAPVPMHQRCIARLMRVLDPLVGGEFELFPAPLDVVLADDTVLQPDLLVARVAELTARNLPAAPMLATEILSPSTRRIDLLLKRSRYEAAGCPAYWVVDPDEPSIIAWELRDGTYAEAGRASGSDVLALTAPFAIRVVPSDLVN